LGWNFFSSSHHSSEEAVPKIRHPRTAYSCVNSNSGPPAPSRPELERPKHRLTGELGSHLVAGNSTNPAAMTKASSQHYLQNLGRSHFNTKADQNRSILPIQ